MVGEQVRMWRPTDEDRVLLMAGPSTGYKVDPRGEYVFGVITDRPMRSQRGPERRLVQPGHLVAWDPSNAHTGTAVDRQAWSSRLMVIEATDLAALASDEDTSAVTNIAFADPVISDPRLVNAFLRLHAALEAPATKLERDEQLAEWLRTLIDRHSRTRPSGAARSARDDRAFRLAWDFLADRPERNVSLEELSIAAGIGKFRLMRLFRERTGLPPHAFHIAHRVRAARRLLEAGHNIGDVALGTGFADQSHLHRHFQRGLGITPGQYQQRFTA